MQYELIARLCQDKNRTLIFYGRQNILFNMSGTTTIYKKLTNLEQEVQKLKVQAYFSLPKNRQTLGVYPLAEINDAVKLTRGQIWQKKYAKKL